MTAYLLRQLYVYLTEGCNLACRHCWLAPKFDPNASRYPVLAVESFTRAIEEARPLGLAAVKLTGGEPLLHPHILDLLEIVRQAGLRLTVETNGVLCTPQVAAAIAAFDRPFVSVSLDGADRQAHEWVRGVPGAFDQAMAGIANLVAVGVRPQVIFSLMAHNAGQVDAIVRLAEEKGAASVKFNLVQPTARGENLHSQQKTLPIAELITLGQYVENDLAYQTSLLLDYGYPLAFRSLQRISRNGGSLCAVHSILGLLPTGHYALCGIGEHLPELVLGQVYQDALADVWQHPTLEAIRRGLPESLTGVCGRCLVKSRCLGSCIAQNVYRNHDLFAPNWFCEGAEQAGLFPVSRLV